MAVINWVVVSNIFYFHPYLGKWSNLTNIFQMGWNHQQIIIFRWCVKVFLTTKPAVSTAGHEGCFAACLESMDLRMPKSSWLNIEKAWLGLGIPGRVYKNRRQNYHRDLKLSHHVKGDTFKKKKNIIFLVKYLCLDSLAFSKRQKKGWLGGFFGGMQPAAFSFRPRVFFFCPKNGELSQWLCGWHPVWEGVGSKFIFTYTFQKN